MSFSQFLLILKARKKTVIWTFVFVFGVTLIVSLVVPKSYTATTSLVVNYKGVDPLTGMVMPAQLMPGYMATQIDIITSHAVAVKVVRKLNLSGSPTIIEQFADQGESGLNIDDWLADLLINGLRVKPSRESSMLDISFTGADPHFSAAIANAFADAYQEASLHLKVEPSRKAADYLVTQAQSYREKLEAAQAKLSKYQQENGLTSVMENLDVENAKLNQLAAQLVNAQSVALDSVARQQNASLAGESSPDVAASPVVQNLKVSLAQANSKLAEVGNRLGHNHPQYLSVQAEVDKLRNQLDSEVLRVRSTVGSNAKIHQQSQAQLKLELAAQKQKVLELNRSRDQLSVLQRDVESAQQAFNTVSQRLNQTSLEGKADESDVSVLNLAIPPVKPSSPKILLNLVISLILGVGLGVGIAFLRELNDRKIRSSNDFFTIVNVPVIAVIANNYDVNRMLELPRNPTSFLISKK